MSVYQIKLPKNIIDLKEKIILRNDYSSHEVNDAILVEIKKSFENINNMKIIEGRKKCQFSLNNREVKLIEAINSIYGITLTQLYISAIIEIGKKEKII